MMKPSRPSPHDTVARYFEQAATLRLCLQYNSEDYEYSQVGGRIVYLMDANIVRFFIDPEAEASHVVAFGRSPLPDYAAGTALITAEFLFSRGLAGQNDRPALIAPAHGDEITNIIAEHRAELSKSAPPIGAQPLPPDTVKRLSALIDRVSRAGEKDRAKAVAELQQLVPEAAGDLLRGGWQRMQQLRRLYDEDLLRPLSLHTAATRDILEPDRAEVDAWAERIRQERILLPNGQRRELSRRDLEREQQRADADAEALVQTMLLDAATVEEGERTRYVLVTADHRLFDAYAKWYWGGGGKTRNRSFVLRLPLQYAPILNVQEMPNGISNSKVFRSATTALDSLFTNLSRTDTAYPHKLAFYRIQARTTDVNDILTDFYGTNPLRLEGAALREFEGIRNSWHASFRSGVLLNAELMQRRMQAEFGPLARLLRDSTDLRAAIHEDQRRSLRQVENSHLLFSTRLNLILLTRGRRDTAGPVSQRAPFPVRAHFPHILGDEPLKMALDRLARSDYNVIGRIYDALNDASFDHSAFFFAACVAFRCEHWAAAIHYASRAHDLMEVAGKLPAERAEASYLVALATRYAVGNCMSGNPLGERAIRRALVLLDESTEMCGVRRDDFGLIRALNERNALALVLLYRACLLDRLNEPLVRQQTTGFAERTKQVAHMLSRLPKQLAHQKDPTTIDSLRTQALANVISAAVLTRWLAPNHDLLIQIAPHPDQVAEAVDELETLVTRLDCPPVLALEHMMARCALGGASWTEAQHALEELAARGDGEGDRWSLDLDRAELDHFRHLLASDGEVAGLGPVADTIA
jgi:hypothetical protein